MATYVIGDVHGCYQSLQKLLKKINFDPNNDLLWFVGDIINRGPESLKTLEFVISLGDSAKMILGNHEFHLLSAYAGLQKFKDKTDTLIPILNHPNVKEMIDWLRHKPLIVQDKSTNSIMVHAGIPPQWSIKKALKKAKKVERVLQDDNWQQYIKEHCFGNVPNYWSKNLSSWEKIRYTINACARMRYCDANGVLDFELKMHPDQNPHKDTLQPWFSWQNRKSYDTEIYFGHWSTIGVLDAYNVHAIDTGCLWDGMLSAYNIENKQRITVNC